MKSVVAFLLIVASTAAQAQSSCALIRDTDDRWLCRARDEGKNVYCASIQDPVKRRICGAQTGRPNECASITDLTRRHYCEGFSR
ncbi:MAG: hypothetical protein EOP83_20005 [Verrucomicrobiaceae bacterium]|nr:MAG: hypothetical protein EOP83_20005 [Verrucomicrobiaceae bacterium]